MIDVEAYILFLSAALFTILDISFESARQNKHDSNIVATTLSVFAAGSWQGLSLVWLPLVAETPTYSTYAVALLWQAFAIVFYVVTVFHVFDAWRYHKWGSSLGDDEE